MPAKKRPSKKPKPTDSPPHPDPDKVSLIPVRINLERPAYRLLCIMAAQSEPIVKAHVLAAELLTNALMKGKV
jgi:hypothetical protein